MVCECPEELEAAVLTEVFAGGRSCPAAGPAGWLRDPATMALARPTVAVCKGPPASVSESRVTSQNTHSPGTLRVNNVFFSIRGLF